MLLLAIDTSLQGVTLGLAKLEGQVYDILDLYGSTHPQEAAARLPELCSSLLQKQGLTLKDIDGMLISHGPGSFTGIKIGLSFASGWNRAGTRIKVWGVSSFQGLLKQRPDTATLLLPATQTAGYFVAKNSSGDPRLGVIDLSHGSVASIFDSSLEKLTSYAPESFGRTEILGSWPRLEEWMSSQQIAWQSVDTSTLYRSVIAGMIEEFVAKSPELSEGKLMPIYLRKSAPEEKLDQAQAKS